MLTRFCITPIPLYDWYGLASPMHGFSSRILAVMLAGVMAVSAGVCPCAKAECRMPAAGPARDQDHSCCRKSALRPKSQTDDSHARSSHRCANCVTASLADRPSQDNPAIGLSVMPVMMMSLGMPTVHALLAAPGHIGREHVPGPPLLADLFHSSCLLTV